jgi:sulfate adenylyltransferase subunit 2
LTVAVSVPQIPDTASAEEVLAYAVERFHPQLTMACSFQKEESVLVHMLMGICPEARVFTIDSGVLFPETLQTWKRFEDRFGVQIEVIDARSPGEPWTLQRCCTEAKVDALERALDGVEAWISGIRREQAPTRSAASKLERDERRGIWKVNPLVDWSATSTSTIFLTTRCTIRAMRRSAAPRARSPAPGGKGGGPAPTRSSAGSTSDGFHRRMNPQHYELSYLEALESESIHIFREVAAEFERPVLLFSGGKDSLVLLRLAEKAFRPGRFPFPIMHVDTGHNFPEVIEFRDQVIEQLGERLIVASVQDSIDKGRVVEETGPRASRNRLQIVTLLDAIAEHGFDAAFGGARRDEERARAKERVFSFRDDFGQWDPKSQRPELWALYNARINKGEHVRVFPISNWTELDVWQYIAAEGLEIPSIYYSHNRQVFERDGMLYAYSDHVQLIDGEEPFETSVRYRTVGDMTCTGAVRSTAATLEQVVAEIAATRITERGETRADDRVTEAAMEDRKREGYF